MKSLAFALLLFASYNVSAFVVHTSSQPRNRSVILAAAKRPSSSTDRRSRRLITRENGRLKNRRDVMETVFISGVMPVTLGGFAGPAQAKVEGYAPPKKSLSEEYRQGTAALADIDENAVVPKEAYKKLPSGVIYADLRTGNGEEAREGSRVNIQWVLRKSNGYFVDSSAVSDSVPFIFTVGDPAGAIAGVDEGIRGMRVGGVRRILIPPSLAYVTGLEDGKPGPVPAGFGPKQQMRRVQEVRRDVPGEYIYLEIQLTRVR